MKVITNERVVPVDCDDTLIMHGVTLNNALPTIFVLDPLTGKRVEYVINVPMVRLLKEEKQRGSTIIVWSRGGYQWAANIITALGLEASVDLIMTKPLTYFDDKPVDQWMIDRVYLPWNVPYKNNLI